ncbi:flagellar hook-basal body complex protein FliE [Photobacterium sp. DNB23_23_1]|uniref:Flagellar hook-basal body complex protein FliE n=1 Tax=Photobacterium pectinilyticum TaxID=2906793 RepID=A0ABT1MY46_9GAMM|nr:flagellar hook-basal body complex protein FliE [Photobacterium sp. ZSDE20]MCQ1057415.1 flagellar hook-basal body complex protein FliE [Photobacterium sp. ZSDE20]MDD1821636.1 flagellar hook-basal body complex protein FliE [Photobacterium sp. ZSDE20]
MSNQTSMMQNEMLQRMAVMREQAQSGTQVAVNLSHPSTGNFQTAMQQAVRRIDNQQHTAHQLTADVDAGRSDDLVGAMVASQKASISFSALTQVRNKLLAAYDDVLKMPL